MPPWEDASTSDAGGASGWSLRYLYMAQRILPRTGHVACCWGRGVLWVMPGGATSPLVVGSVAALLRPGATPLVIAGMGLLGAAILGSSVPEALRQRAADPQA
jgi:hypothetical protein